MGRAERVGRFAAGAVAKSTVVDRSAFLDCDRADDVFGVSDDDGVEDESAEEGDVGGILRVFNGEDMIYTNCIFGCLYDFESFLKVCFIDACEVLFMFG